ncbi:hypothetical protein KDL29_16130 [bacterium]|nr:hypothetical protein [bacterium]
MWKGIAWLMLLYGLLVTAAVVDAGDKKQGLAQMFSSWQQNYAALKERMQADGIEAPPVARFDGHDPLVAISGKATTELMDDGQEGWLEWTPDRETAPIDLLGLMLRPGPPDANALAMDMRASYDGQVVVGVMERDGSSYTVFPERLEREWTHYEFPLVLMTLSDDSEDENGQLDVDQLESVLIGYLDTKQGTTAEDGPRVIEIDEVHFQRVSDNPMFPDFRPGMGEGGPGGGPGRRNGEEGPGMGQGDGPPPGQGRQRPRERLRDRIDQRQEGSGQ